MNAQIPDNNLFYQKIIEQDLKLEQIKKSVDSLKKFFLLNFIISVLMIVLPLIAAVFTVPYLLNSLNSINLPSQLNTIQKMGL